MAIAIPKLDFLSSDDLTRLCAELMRVAAQSPGAVIDLRPTVPADKHIYLLPLAGPYASAPEDDASPEGDEFRRRLARSEEFIEFEATSVTVADR